VFRGRGQGQLRCAPAVDGDSAALRDGHGLIATSKQCGVLSDTGHEGRRVEARPADLARHAASVAFGALFFLIGDHQTGHQLTVAVGAACYAARAQLNRHGNACRFCCDAGNQASSLPSTLAVWHDMNPSADVFAA